MLAFGYSAIQNAMTQDAGVTAGILLAIALGKILTTGLTIGSGGSGGVFGPSMVIGGCGGGALGVVFHHLWPGLVPHPASFVIVGMAGFFAAAAKTPFSTHHHRQRDDRRLPLAAAVAVGLHLVLHPLRQAVDLFLASGKPIPLAGPSRELRAQVLAKVRVSRFLSPGRGTAVLQPGRFAGQGDRPAQRGIRTRCCPWWMATIGFWAWSPWRKSILPPKSPSLQSLVLAEDLMRSDVQPLTPDDTLDRALELFVENDLLTLPVVTNLKERQVLGMVSRFDISSAYLRHVHGPAEAK